MTMYYPRHRVDGTQPENYKAQADAYFAQLAALENSAVHVDYEQGDFYDTVHYTMPDGSVWVRTISNEYCLEYSLEEVSA